MTSSQVSALRPDTRDSYSLDLDWTSLEHGVRTKPNYPVYKRTLLLKHCHTPDNILLSTPSIKESRAKLADFGLAKLNNKRAATVLPLPGTTGPASTHHVALAHTTSREKQMDESVAVVHTQITPQVTESPPSVKDGPPVERPSENLLDLLDTVALDRLQNNMGSWPSSGATQAQNYSFAPPAPHVLNDDRLSPWKDPDAAGCAPIEPRVLAEKRLNTVTDGQQLFVEIPVGENEPIISLATPPSSKCKSIQRQC